MPPSTPRCSTPRCATATGSAAPIPTACWIRPSRWTTPSSAATAPTWPSRCTTPAATITASAARAAAPRRRSLLVPPAPGRLLRDRGNLVDDGVDEASALPVHAQDEDRLDHLTVAVELQRPARRLHSGQRILQRVAHAVAVGE